MSHGGARAGSGPAPDPNSGRSASRGLNFTQLPAEGYGGDVPAFPLEPLVFNDEDPLGGGFSARELAVWNEAWSTPQATAWALESWRWPVIAEYCRLKVTIERDPGANAALVGHLHRYREQIGLTDSGMAKNGWQIDRDEIQEQRTKKASGSSAKPLSARERRLRAVKDDNGT